MGVDGYVFQDSSKAAGRLINLGLFQKIGKSLHEVVYSFLPLFQELLAEHRKVSAVRKCFDLQSSKSRM